MSKLATINVRFQYKGRRTTCIIDNQEGQRLASSYVKRMETDVDDKKYARKKAFKKAMLQTNTVLSKGERTTIWNTFLTTVKQPIK